MAKLFFSVLLLLSVSFAETSDDFFNMSSDNLKEDLQTAKTEGKKGVFIFFHMEECPFCHKMEMNVLNQSDVIKYYKNNFLNFIIDIHGDVELADFQGKETTQKKFSFKNRVRATPVLAFFDLNGKLIFKRTGFLNKDEFLLMGKYVAKDIYKKINFIRYKRKLLK